MKAWHDENKGVCPGFDCSFRWEACLLAGSLIPFEQPYKTVPLVGGQALTLLTYDITVACDADDLGDKRIAPVYLPQDPSTQCVDQAQPLPPVCITPDMDSLEPGVGPWSPFRNVAKNDAASDAGSYAELSWSFAGLSDSIRTDELDAELHFSASDCPGGDCFQLSELSATIPTTVYEGHTISDASVHTWGLSAAPLIGSRSDLSFPKGSLYAVASGRVNGTPFAASSRTIDVAWGRSSEISNSFSLHNVVLGFDQAGAHAELRLEIEGVFRNRSPHVTIAVINAPRDCKEPVTFVARGVDLDADNLSYAWVVPSGIAINHNMLDLAMEDDETTYLVVTATDEHHRFGSAAIEYRRNCQ